jgi:hypothetical protein
MVPNCLVQASGDAFDEAVADEIWGQTVRHEPVLQLRVFDICSTFVEAQNILKIKLQEVNSQIASLVAEKRKLQGKLDQESIRKLEGLS